MQCVVLRSGHEEVPAAVAYGAAIFGWGGCWWSALLCSLQSLPESPKLRDQHQQQRHSRHKPFGAIGVSRSAKSDLVCVLKSAELGLLYVCIAGY